MRLYKIAMRPPGHAQPNPGRFRTVCTVMADTLANKTYELRIAKLKKSSEEAEAAHPKLYKATKFATRFSFWTGMAVAERLLSQGLGMGSVLSCGIVYGHIYPASILAQRIKERIHPPTEGKKSGIKPSGAAYMGALSIAEVFSIPLYTFVMSRAVHLSQGLVHPLLAAFSVVAATAAAIAFEYPAFRIIWKKFVLRNMPAGTIGDDVRGFVDEFRPLALFIGWKAGHPVKSAAEYIGQIWGVIESHWIWLQSFRVAFAAAFTLAVGAIPKLAVLFPTDPARFVDSMFSAMVVVGTMVGSAVSSRNFDAILAKIEENNKSLGIDD